MIGRFAMAAVAAAGICVSMPAGAEQVGIGIGAGPAGVGVTVGTGHGTAIVTARWSVSGGIAIATKPW